MYRIVSLAAGATVCIAASGCLVVTGNSTRESGVRVSPTTLSQIEPGTTSETWLLATLGEPTSRTKVECQDRKVEILRYEHNVHKSSGGAVFLIFAGGSERSNRSVAYFEVTDGIVTRAWTESDPLPTA